MGRYQKKISFETMEAVPDSVDIGMNSEGDIMVHQEGEPLYGDKGSLEDVMEVSLERDIAKSGNLRGRVAEQIIMKRLLSEPEDWERDPNSGAYLSQYIGEKMNSQTLTAIKNSISRTLTYDGFIRTENLIVEVIPVTKHVINIVLLAKKRFTGDYLVHSFGFNLNEQAMLTDWTGMRR